MYRLIIESVLFEFSLYKMVPAACNDRNACGTVQQMMIENSTTTNNVVLRKITTYTRLPFKNQISAAHNY